MTAFHLLAFLLILASTVAATNATAVYRSNTGACAANVLNCPKIREWNSTGAGSWGSAVELATAGSPVREAQIVYSNVSPKRLVVTQSDDGQLDAYVSFNGYEWTATNDIGRVWTAAPATHSHRVGMWFETMTGDAIVVYAVESASTTCDLAYKVLPANESNFSAISEQCIDDTTHALDLQYSWIKVAGNPLSTSEEIVVVGFNTNDSHVGAWVWNGSAWGNEMEVTNSATGTGGYEGMDVAYAADGSKAMVVSSNGTAGTVNTYYWNSTAWVDSPDFSVAGAGNDATRWITLKADPSTDDMQAVIVDGGNDLSTAYWSGAAWTATIDIDTGLDLSTSRLADFAWNPTGSTGKLVWDTDGAGTTLSNRTCSPQCTAATGTGSTYAGTGAWLTLFTNPTAADALNILGLRLNNAFDIGSLSWNGSVFANYGDSALTADTTVSTYEACGVDFQKAFDLLAPTYANQAQNSSALPQGGTNYLTAQWTDNVQLHTAILETNETGASLNKTVYGSPVRMFGNLSLANFTWSNASLPVGTNISWRIWANDTAGRWNVTPSMSFIIASYNFTISPTLDNFSVVNNTYIDRNYTMTNTGNQVLSINCSSNASWATNLTACPVSLGVGSQTNITFRFDATGQPAGNPQVLLNFSSPNVNATAIANVTITPGNPVITVVLLQPTSATSTDPATPFNQNCNASCANVQCDTVNLYAQYSNDGGTSYFNMTTSTPLNTSTTQPQSCGNIAAGSSCNKTWIVSGKSPGTYKIRCWSNSTNAPDAVSAIPSFDVTADAFVETSISPASIIFGALDPGTTDNSSTNNPMTLTVTANTNVNVDTYLNATHLTYLGSTLGVGNMSVSKTGGGVKMQLTLAFLGTAYYSNTAPSGTQSFYFYLTAPLGMDAGDYTGAVTLKTVQYGVVP